MICMRCTNITTSVVRDEINQVREIEAIEQFPFAPDKIVSIFLQNTFIYELMQYKSLNFDSFRYVKAARHCC